MWRIASWRPKTIRTLFAVKTLIESPTSVPADADEKAVVRTEGESCDGKRVAG